MEGYEALEVKKFEAYYMYMYKDSKMKPIKWCLKRRGGGEKLEQRE
jgi:hypothetical protein